MMIRQALWHTLPPEAVIRRAGYANHQTLRDAMTDLQPGEVVTVLEPEHDDALTSLAVHFELSILE